MEQCDEVRMRRRAPRLERVEVVLRPLCLAPRELNADLEGDAVVLAWQLLAPALRLRQIALVEVAASDRLRVRASPLLAGVQLHGPLQGGARRRELAPAELHLAQPLPVPPAQRVELDGLANGRSGFRRTPDPPRRLP